MADRIVISSRNFARGQSDTHAPEGQEFPGLQVFANMRGDTGTAKRRAGSVIIGKTTSTGVPIIETTTITTRGLVFDWAYPTPLLTGNQHTVDFAVLIGTTGTRPILGNSVAASPLEIYCTGGDTINVDYTAGADGTKSLSVTLAASTNIAYCRLVRTPGTLKLIVNEQQDTATMTNEADISQPGNTTMYLFEDNGGNFGNSLKLYWLRAFDEAHDHRGFLRDHFPNPRHPSVRYYMCGFTGAHPSHVSVFYDQSSYQRHAHFPTSATGISSGSGENKYATPVQGLIDVRANDGQRTLTAIRDGFIFHGELN